MPYTFEHITEVSFNRRTIYRIDENGNRELYMEQGSPTMYTYGMWADIQLAGTTNPGLQDMIDELIMYYALSRKK